MTCVETLQSNESIFFFSEALASLLTLKIV